jgi:hypothetical protein
MMQRMETMTAEELNEKHTRFWADQAEFLTRRMTDDAVRGTALGLIREQEVRGLPVRYRLSLEQALETAEKIGQRFSAEWSRKGGKAKKTDALQILIDNIVERRPSISTDQLARELRRRERIEVIDEIADGRITFINTDGRLKDARLCGLKDRLSRAKKKLRSR